jgi:hypothetical protein
MGNGLFRGVKACNGVTWLVCEYCEGAGCSNCDTWDWELDVALEQCDWDCSDTLGLDKRSNIR